ncbi:hypothetical protein FGG78_39575, partial [Thioclava sp. BHET1]
MRDSIDIFGRQPQHPLLGGQIEADGAIWCGALSLTRMPWLADHRVGERVILPATAMMELFCAAARGLTGPEGFELRDMEFLHAVEIPATGEVRLRTRWEPSARRLILEQGNGAGWQFAAVARVFAAMPAQEAPRPPCKTAAVPGFYEALGQGGLHYGPAFARVVGLSQEDGTVRVTLTPGALEGMGLDPTAADACLHGLAAFPTLRLTTGSGPLVPGRIGRLRVLSEGAI